MKKILLALIGAVACIVGAAAQQPAAPPAESKPTAAEGVIEQLRGTAKPTAEEPASMKTVLDRYAQMVKTGADATARTAASQQVDRPRPVVTVKPGATPQASPITSTSTNTNVADNLRGVIAELRGLLTRLEALAEVPR